MVQFLDDNTKFDILPNAVRQTLEFGPTRFFTTLTPGLNIAQLEASLNAGNALFGNAQVVHAMLFNAEAIVVSAKDGAPRFPEIDLRSRFDFGFVQGIKMSDFRVEFWGRFKGHGRTITHISMPNSFEIDTHPLSQPFTRVEAERFEIINVTQAASKFNFLKVRVEGADHPLLSFSHTIDHPTHGSSAPNLVRQVSFKNEFRTIFCLREKKTGDFTPISSTGWTIQFNHVVSYTQNGANQVVADNSPGASIPRKGNPANIDAVDRSILGMAKAGAPLLTPAILAARFATGSSRRTVTPIAENEELPGSNFFT